MLLKRQYSFSIKTKKSFTNLQNRNCYNNYRILLKLNGSNKLALNFLFPAELFTRKEIFIYVYGNYYLRVEKYLFTRK